MSALELALAIARRELREWDEQRRKPYLDLIERAMQGDTEAIDELPGAARELLQSATADRLERL